MRKLVILVVVSVMASYGYARPPRGAEEIHNLVSGNTISGTENGKAYDEYYENDGFIRGRDVEGLYIGEWRVVGRQLCMRYFDDSGVPEEAEDSKGVPGPWECSTLEIEGSALTLMSEGERFPARLRPGNPEKL